MNRFPIRVKPGARRPSVGGAWHGRLGEALVVAVTAPAVDGRANEAVRAALAEALGVPRRDVTIATGARSRDKMIELANPPTDVPTRIRALIDSPPRPDQSTGR